MQPGGDQEAEQQHHGGPQQHGARGGGRAQVQGQVPHQAHQHRGQGGRGGHQVVVRALPARSTKGMSWMQLLVSSKIYNFSIFQVILKAENGEEKQAWMASLGNFTIDDLGIVQVLHQQAGEGVITKLKCSF